MTTLKASDSIAVGIAHGSKPNKRTAHCSAGRGPRRRRDIVVKILLGAALLSLNLAFACPGDRVGKVALEEGERLLEKTQKKVATGAGRKVVGPKINPEIFKEIDPSELRRAAERIEDNKGSLADGEENKAAEVQRSLRTQADELDLLREWAEESQADAQLKEDIITDDSMSERCKKAVEEEIAGVPKAMFCTFLKSYVEDGRPPSDRQLAEALIKFKPDCVVPEPLVRGLKNSRLWRKETEFFNKFNDAIDKQAFADAAVEVACP